MKHGTYIFLMLVFFLLFGCSNYENDTIDARGMKKMNRLLIPPVSSKSASSIGKGHNVKRIFDQQAEEEIRIQGS